MTRGRPSLADEAHGRLRQRLLDGEFAIGEHLAEERLAEELGMSRTPVREALRRLEAEELLIVDPSGGYRPRAPEMGRIADLYQVRICLEVLSVHLASQPGADADQLDQLHRRWSEVQDASGREADFVHVDEAYHIDLARAGGNQVLADSLAQINDRIRIIRVHDFLVPGRIEATVTEHLGILDAVRQGDAETAEARLRAHIGESARLSEDRALRALNLMLRRQAHAR